MKNYNWFWIFLIVLVFLDYAKTENKERIVYEMPEEIDLIQEGDLLRVEKVEIKGDKTFVSIGFFGKN